MHVSFGWLVALWCIAGQRKLNDALDFWFFFFLFFVAMRT
jgi:hypothetical protein